MVSFDQAVKYYDHTRGYPPGVPEQIRDAILEYTHADSDTCFLELGVGTGLIALPFMKAAYHYMGADVSIPMMAQIQAKMGSQVQQNQLSLVQADVTRSLPFPDNTFDVIMAIRVFHVLDDWQAAVTEAKRVLQPDGCFLIARDASVSSANEFDPAMTVHAKWDEILESLGILPGTIQPGLWLSDSTMIAHLREGGALTQAVDLLTYTSSPLSIRMMAERHKQRMYSRDWELPDAIHTAAVKQLNAWLDYECGEPDKIVMMQMAFRAIVARWEN
ncbi:MAG: class I SAM-dependent methyltransferase [Anaerolineae bacterium]|nr:class I SAM-dependent methyltransferase [Anaerolineae bacterium]